MELIHALQMRRLLEVLKSKDQHFLVLISKLVQVPVLDLALMDRDLYFDLEPRERGIGQPEKGEN